MDERPFLALTRGEELLWTVVIAAVLIVLLVGLYVLKDKTGSQGWRVRVPRGVHRICSFMVWLVAMVAKKVPWKPILIWGPWVVMIGAAAFYGIENTRGKKAWERTREALVARGESVDLAEFERPEVAADQSFLAHPAVRDEVRGVHSPELASLRNMKLPGVATRFDLYGPRRGMRADVREWLAPAGTGTEREAAVELLGKLAPLEGRMAAIAEAAARPELGQRWDRSGGDPIMWELSPEVFELLGFTAAFTERSILRLRVHSFSGAIEDFEVAVRMCEYASNDPTILGILVTIAAILQCESAFWELVQDSSIDLERVWPGLEFFRSYEPREAIVEAMKIERAWAVEAIDYLADNRSEGVWWAGPFIDLVPDWAPEWAEEADDILSEWGFRFGPRGWFALWKEEYCQHLDRVLFRPKGKDVTRMAVETPELAERELEKLDGTFGGCMLSIGAHMGQAATRVLFAESRIELMLAALALERYRRAHGRYPANLAELVPEYLAKVPLDVMTDQPLIYRFKPDGTPLLYSVGRNGIDDGGVPARNPGDLDWVWQLTPTAGQSEDEWSWGEKP